MMRFLGGNHTSMYRAVQAVATLLLAHKVLKLLVQLSKLLQIRRHYGTIVLLAACVG